MGLIKTMCLATLGLESKVRDLVDELAQKGEASDSAAAKSVRGLIDRLDRLERDFRKEEGQLVERVCHKLKVPTRSDVESLHRKLDELATSVAALRAGQRGSH